MASITPRIKTRKNTCALEWRRCNDLTLRSSADILYKLQLIVVAGGIVAERKHGEERLLRHFDRADALHALLSFFLLFEEFAFAGDVTAVALGEHVLAHGFHGGSADNLSADGSLDGDVELLARNEVLELHADGVRVGVRLVAVDNDGEGVDRVAVQEDVEFDEVVALVFARRVVEACVAAAQGLEAVVEVEHDFGKRKVVFEDDLRLVDVFHGLERAALFFAKRHHGADIFLWRKDLCLHVRFFDVVVAASVGELGGAFYFHHGAVAHVNVVFHVRHGRDDVHVEFAVEAFLHDFHVQQSEESRAEAKAERFGCFRFPAEGRIVQAELFEGFAQILVVFRVDGVDTRVNHREHVLVAWERFFGRVCCIRERVTDFHVADGFHIREYVTDHAFGEFRARVAMHAECTDFGHHIFAASLHHADFHARLERAFDNADVVDHAAVGIVNGVKDERLERLAGVAFGGRDFIDNLVEHLFHVEARLGRNARNLVRIVTEQITHELGYMVGLCSRKVYFVQNRNDRKVVFDSEVEVRERLGFDTLACIHDENGAFASGEGSADFVSEVHVPRGVDHVQDVFFAVLFVDHADGVCLDGNAAFAFQVHVIEELVHHFVLGDRLGQFNHSVGQGGFAVIDVGDNAKITDIVVLRHIKMLKSFCINIEILCLFYGTCCEPFKKKLYSSLQIILVERYNYGS